MFYYRVLVPLNIKNEDCSLTYSCDEEAAVGSVVKIKIGKIRNIHMGIILQKVTGPTTYKVSAMIICKEIPPWHSNFIDFVLWACRYNLWPLYAIIKITALSYLKNNIHKNQLIETTSPINGNAFGIRDLNHAQRIAYDEMLTFVKNGKFSVNMLWGVTGSGKTEIYCLIIADLLHRNAKAQILIMLPEILLVKQIAERVSGLLNRECAVWHSGVMRTTIRRDTLMRIACNKVSIIIGTRSAVFLPYANLGMVVVDEEHDSSYKQDTGLRYRAGDMAIVRAKYHDIPVILSSATPSLETLYNIKLGKYNCVRLIERVNRKNIEIELIDMRFVGRDCSYISDALLSAIEDNLRNNLQTILFMNRRGYVSVVVCNSCGVRLSCPNCDVALIKHNDGYNAGLFMCHYCTYRTDTIPKSCGACHVDSGFYVSGTRVEKIKEIIKDKFPYANIQLASTDCDVGASGFMKSLEKADIIVGTQLIAKGHNFPRLSLVAILDGDDTGYLYDFRADERSWQMINQVIGRVGRFDGMMSRIIIQSYNIKSKRIELLKNSCINEYYDLLLNDRKRLRLPPYVRFINIIITSTKKDNACRYAKELYQLARVIAREYQEIIKIYPPAPAFIKRVNGRHRFMILVVCNKNAVINYNFYKTLSDKSRSPDIILNFDVDPVCFF